MKNIANIYLQCRIPQREYNPVQPYLSEGKENIYFWAMNANSTLHWEEYIISEVFIRFSLLGVDVECWNAPP